MTYRAFHPPLRTLMGPGPSDVPPRILEALGRPTIGHLDPAFVHAHDDAPDVSTIPIRGLDPGELAALNAERRLGLDPNEMTVIAAYFGELDRGVAQDGCESCHHVESWRASAKTFDHARTRFALAGAHAKPACAACHERVDIGTERERVRYAGVPLTCQGCHEDTHRGQFEVSCDRCHDPDSLKASRFDHARDSAWPLDGAHARVACAECHRRETRDGVEFVRYKPLPSACRDCHTAARFGARDAQAP